MTQIKLTLLANAQQGYHIILNSPEIADSITGILPPLPPELESSFHNWQSAYRDLEDVRKVANYRVIKPKKIVQYSGYEQKKSVKTLLNQWLNSGYSGWLPVRDELNAIAGKIANSGGEIRILLDIDDHKLCRIPWQEWDLLEAKYANAELAIRVRGTDKIQPIPQGDKVRILLVVGQSEGIDTQADLTVIKNLEKKGAEVVILQQPTADDLFNALWEDKGYHIFVYTGHSSSDETGKIGSIELNEQEEPLSIESFKNSFKEAINKGLQLAIFNSCDGLGLAHQLAEVNLPRILFMREPVPDKVAVEFLKYFFEEFSQNKSLFTSVNRAKKRLQPIEQKYPGAMWLPTICLRESALDQPLVWNNLITKESFIINLFLIIIQNLQNKKNIGLVIGVLVVLGIILLMINKDERNEELLSTIINTDNVSINIKKHKETFKDVVKIPAGTWLHGGSTSWASIGSKVNSKIEEVLPQFNLSYTSHPTLPPGSRTGIKMLIDGKISFAESSRPLNQDELEQAENRGLKLQSYPVAIDGIAIVVNPSLNIQRLTVQQLKDIYTGKIKNWSEVGGQDLPIIPYSRPTESGTTEYFDNEVLGQDNFGENVINIDTTTQVLRELEKNPGGIYFAAASEVVSQCSVKPLPIALNPNTRFIPPYQGYLVPPENCPQQRNEINFEAFKNQEYPLTRRLFVIVKKDGGLDQQAGEAYYHLLLTDEGQELIEEAGYIPIR